MSASLTFTGSIALEACWLAVADVPIAAPRARLDIGRLGTLLESARAGDARAFRAFVDETMPVVYRLTLRTLADPHESEDAVQETYVRAWQGLEHLRDLKAALAWVCRIARNVAADRARASGRRRRALVDDGGRAWAERIAGEAEGPEELMQRAEARALVRACLEELPEKHRLVLWLREVDQLSAEETAAALGVAVGTVDSRLSRARAKLARRVRAAARRRP